MYLPPPEPNVPKPAWFLGLDLAQRQDFTTLALLNLGWRKVEQDRATWEWIRKPEITLCALDRYPQGDSYLAYCNIVERRIDQIRAAEPLSTIHLVIDSSGPGAPIVEEFDRSGLKIDINPITMTGGHDVTANKHAGQNVPRRNLITKLILLLEHGSFKAVPGIPNLDDFQNEMLGLRANDTATGATALAAWQAIETTPELLPTRQRRRVYIAAGTRRLL